MYQWRILNLFLFLVLFSTHHVQARLGETYAESVVRYEKAGYAKTVSTIQVPPNDENKPWCNVAEEGANEVVAVNEILWVNRSEFNDDALSRLKQKAKDVVGVCQTFQGRFKGKDADSQSVDSMRCWCIAYSFRNSGAMSAEDYIAVLLAVTDTEKSDWTNMEGADAPTLLRDKPLMSASFQNGQIVLLDHENNVTIDTKKLIDKAKSGKELGKAKRDMQDTGL